MSKIPISLAERKYRAMKLRSDANHHIAVENGKRAKEEHDRAERLIKVRDFLKEKIKSLSAKAEAFEHMAAVARGQHRTEVTRLKEERDNYKRLYREGYEAFCAMRNDINELLGNMRSSESVLLEGPEMANECAAVVEAVRQSIDRPSKSLTSDKPIGGALRQLVEMVEVETGATTICAADPDDESVGWSSEGSLPMTFGHVRRAIAELSELESIGQILASVKPLDLANLIRHAFLSGRGKDPVDSEGLKAWAVYRPPSKPLSRVNDALSCRLIIKPPGKWPRGSRVRIEHDGFEGTVLDPYTTLEGKKGQVVQLDNARVVHVYGEKWLKPAEDSEPVAVIRYDNAGNEMPQVISCNEMPDGDHRVYAKPVHFETDNGHSFDMIPPETRLPKNHGRFTDKWGERVNHKEGRWMLSSDYDNLADWSKDQFKRLGEEIKMLVAENSRLKRKVRKGQL